MLALCIFVSSVALAIGCTNSKTQMYDDSGIDILNPSRGFMKYSKTQASSFRMLTTSELAGYRDNDGITVVWRLYELDTFVTSPLDQTFLGQLRDDLEVIRQAKFTAVIRFAYTFTWATQAPYGDADKPTMLGHISQLGPVLSDFSDVIDVMQAGFIGVYGEWYYTTYFGDPNFLDWDYPRGLTPEQWNDRQQILDAILNAIPSSIPVPVRYPQAKQIFTDITPTTEQEMLQRTRKARISHHNDCFLASPDDYGTYVDKETEYPYLQEDSKYSTDGGETCIPLDLSSDRHHCPTALQEMRDLHYTNLNRDYSLDVLNIWMQEGCFEEIHRRMGYRILFLQNSLSTVVQTGQTLCYDITLGNGGYAAAGRQHRIDLVLVAADGSMYSADITGGKDLRTLLPDTTVSYNGNIGVPATMPLQTYDAYVAIRPLSKLSDADLNILSPSYGVPDFSNNLNKLNIAVQISGSSPGLGDTQFSAFAQTAKTFNRRYCGFDGCGEIVPPCTPYDVRNPSFEISDDSWAQFAPNGYEFTTQAYQGVQAIMVANGGAQQIFTTPGIKYLKMSAYSKNKNMAKKTKRSNDYSIYCDLLLVDGTWSYGHIAQFNVLQTSYHQAVLEIHTSVGIDQAYCNLLYRNFSSGEAYFDDVQVTTSYYENPIC